MTQDFANRPSKASPDHPVWCAAVVASVVLGLVLGTGCGPTKVSGKVDGSGVGGPKSAIYDTIEITLGPLGTHISGLVIITDFADACNVYEDFFDTIEPVCEDRCNAYMRFADDYLGRDEYWSLTFHFEADGDIVDNFDFNSVPFSDEFSAGFGRWDTSTLGDLDACISACTDNELLEFESDDADNGSFAIESEAGEVITGIFDLGFGGEDALEGTFEAQRCDMWDWIF